MHRTKVCAEYKCRLSLRKSMQTEGEQSAYFRGENGDYDKLDNPWPESPLAPESKSTNKDMNDSDSQTPPVPPSKEELRLAMKAFRKRLKLTRLDDESGLGYGPMSSGQKSGIAAITPPDQFSKAIWQELANQGKLKHAGGRLYSLVE